MATTCYYAPPTADQLDALDRMTALLSGAAASVEEALQDHAHDAGPHVSPVMLAALAQVVGVLDEVLGAMLATIQQAAD